MAEKRMFAKSIIDSDAFLDMPLSTQALYFHLSMRADDEGFINNPKKIQRMIGASEDDLKLLIAKSFIIPFESGIVVIKHWRIHNYIRQDRLHPTKYTEERGLLEIKENGAYTIPTDTCQSNDSQMSGVCHTEIRLDKIRLEENRLEEESKPTAKRFSPPSVTEVEAYCRERNNNIDAETFVDFYTAKGWRVGNNPMKDWKAAVRTWEKRDSKPKAKTKPANSKLQELEALYLEE